MSSTVGVIGVRGYGLACAIELKTRGFGGRFEGLPWQLAVPHEARMVFFTTPELLEERIGLVRPIE